MTDKLTFRLAGALRDLQLTVPVMTLGRHPDCELMLDDPSVSRVHVRFNHTGRIWTVTDLRSRNGTRVNDVPLEPQRPMPIKDGDVITAGAVRMELVGEERGRVVVGDESTSEGVSVTMIRPVTFDDLFQPPPLPAGAPVELVQAIRRMKDGARIASELGRRLALYRPLPEVMQEVLALVFEATAAERAAVLMWDADAQALVPKAVRGRQGPIEQGIQVSRSIVDRAFSTGSTVHREAVRRPSDSFVLLGIGSAVAAPLWQASGVTGVIYADSPLTGVFDPFATELLSALANQAALALEQARLQATLRQKERAIQRLSRYSPSSVVDRLIVDLDASIGLEMRAQEAEVTVLFCDMVGFTAMTELLEPSAVMSLINHCFAQMTEAVFAHGGTLDKYIGDALMAVFGAPEPQPDHAARAARTALALRDIVRELGSTIANLGFRIGLNSGRVIAGDVGSPHRRDWTVLGAHVNLAARVEIMAERDQILVSEFTRALLGDAFIVEPRGGRMPKGFSREIELFELIAAR